MKNNARIILLATFALAGGSFTLGACGGGGGGGGAGGGGTGGGSTSGSNSTTTTTGSMSSSTSSSGSSTSSSSSSSGMPVDCSGILMPSDCATCIETNCCAELKACKDDPDCFYCLGNPQVCPAPSSQMTADTYKACYEAKCPNLGCM